MIIIRQGRKPAITPEDKFRGSCFYCGCMIEMERKELDWNCNSAMVQCPSCESAPIKFHSGAAKRELLTEII